MASPVDFLTGNIPVWSYMISPICINWTDVFHGCSVEVAEATQTFSTQAVIKIIVRDLASINDFQTSSNTNSKKSPPQP